MPPRQAIETFLTEIVERSLESRLGCLLANAALEVAPHDPEIAAVVAERMGELEAFFRRCVIAGQHDGSISPGVDPADAARLLLTTVMGLRVLARGFPNRAVLEGAARQALSVLGKPSSPAKAVQLANSRKRPAMIRFYYHPTPNPLKISLFLEETGLPYEVRPCRHEQGRAAPAGLQENQSERQGASDHRHRRPGR